MPYASTNIHLTQYKLLTPSVTLNFVVSTYPDAQVHMLTSIKLFIIIMALSLLVLKLCMTQTVGYNIQANLYDPPTPSSLPMWLWA